MCPWVGPHAPSFGRQLWGLPSRVEYLSPQGVLLPLVYGTTASTLWLQLRGHSAFGFTRIGEEERRDGEAIALHKTHICPPCPSLKFFAHIWGLCSAS